MSRVKIHNLSEVVSQLKGQIKEGKRGRELQLPRPSLMTSTAHRSSMLALFDGTTPITYEEYQTKLLAAFSKNMTAEEAGLVMAEVKYLEREQPEVYKAWLALAAQKGGLDAVSSYWGTAGKANRLLDLNKLLESKDGSSTITASSLSLYNAQYVKFSLEKEPTYAMSENLEEIKLRKDEIWGRLCRSYVATYLAPDSPREDSSRVNRYAGGKGAYLGVKCKDSAGRDLIVVGGLYYNPTFQKLDSDKLPISVYEKPADGIEDSVLPPGAIRSFEIGHTKAAKRQSSGALVELLQAVRDELASNPARDQEENILIGELDTILKELEPAYRRMAAIDKIHIHPSALATESGSDRLIDVLWDTVSDQAALLGAEEILIVREEKGALRTEVITVPFTLSASIYFPEWAPANSYKGAKTGNFAKNLDNLLKNLVYKEGLSILYEEGSSSMLEEALLKALQESIEPLTNDNKIAAKVVKKGKKAPKTITKTKFKQAKPKKLDVKRTSSLTKMVDEKLKKDVKNLRNQIIIAGKKKLSDDKKALPSVVRGKFDIGSFDSEDSGFQGSVLDTINANIRNAVMEQMKPPALVNRTGRFADSVRITSASQNAINYTYKRNPYAVFSKRIGVSPWNSVQERDPHTIIRKAIGSILQSRFPGAFKPEVKESM